MSPVATETPTPGWGFSPTPAYTIICTGELHHERGRYPRTAVVFEMSGAVTKPTCQLASRSISLGFLLSEVLAYRLRYQLENFLVLRANGVGVHRFEFSE